MTGVVAESGGLTAAEKALQRGEGEEAAAAVAEPREPANDEAVEQRQPANEDRPPEKDKSRTVPIGALHEEREERKKAEKRAERMEQLFQQLVSERSKPAEAKQAPADDLPDISEKPVEHLDARTARLEAEARERREAEQRQSQQAAEIRKIQGQIATKERVFAEETPDYGEALAFARNLNTRRYYRATGDLNAAMQMAQRDELDFAVANLKRGKNPARAAYNLARDWGYKAGGNKPLPAPSNENKMTALEGGAAASRSTSAGRGAGDGEMSLEKLAEMDASSPEFQKHWRRMINKDA